MVTMDDSLLVFDESVVGSAVGHLTFEVPGENALIDTFVSVRNDEEAEQGSLNSTLRWSTSSSWTDNGDIYFFGDLTALDFSEEEVETESYLGAPYSSVNSWWANYNYTDYEVRACPGDRIYVDLCDERATCNGDTYMTFLSSTGYYLMSNDNACGFCSSLSYAVPHWVTYCESYTARLGCADNYACSGTPLFRKTTTNHSKAFKSWRARETLTYGDNQYRATTYLFGGSSEYLSAFGSGQYSVENAYKW
jgi:hypothetical protein